MHFKLEPSLKPLYFVTSIQTGYRFLGQLSSALGWMTIVLQFCDASTGQQIELSVAGLVRTSWKGPIGLSVENAPPALLGYPTRKWHAEKDDADILTPCHYNFMLIPNYATFFMIDLYTANFTHTSHIHINCPNVYRNMRKNNTLQTENSCIPPLHSWTNRV